MSWRTGVSIPGMIAVRIRRLPGWHPFRHQRPWAVQIPRQRRARDKVREILTHDGVDLGKITHVGQENCQFDDVIE